jgi:hypothetical protein
MFCYREGVLGVKISVAEPELQGAVYMADA